jgi:hypothetical protein
VPHQLLHAHHIDTALDEPRRKTVPQAVGGKSGIDLMEYPLHCHRNRVAMKRVVAAEDEPACGFRRQQRSDALHRPWIWIVACPGDPDVPCLMILDAPHAVFELIPGFPSLDDTPMAAGGRCALPAWPKQIRAHRLRLHEHRRSYQIRMGEVLELGPTEAVEPK